MPTLNESKVENLCIELLQEQGYSYLSQEKQEAERELDLSQVVLQSRLKYAIKRLNPTIPPEIHQDKIREALQQVLNLPHQKLIDNNEAFHKILTEGIRVEYQKKEGPRWYSIFLIDFENPKSNDFLVCNQFTVTQNNEVRRTDLVLFVNGLPLVVLELKNPTDEQATVHKAFTQLQNYKKFISKLFFYNEILVASDGLDAKAGSLSADWDRFIAWKSVDGIKEEQKTTSQIETLIKGMLRPVVLLDLIRHFTVFEKTTGFIPARDGNKANITQIMTLKKIAAYHQYFTVNKAVESTIRALAKDKDLIKEKPESYDLESVEKQKKGDKRVGIVWHTQGSGKSLSMVFYAGKLIVDSRMGNLTIVVITDRNDLDAQLFDTFASSRHLLRQEPKQAKDRSHVKQLLQTAGGGVIFTTIQKFFPDDRNESFALLSDRSNIVVIADEAHRSQYGFGAKVFTAKDESFIRYGFAKYLRDALPKASFVGFTATPIEKEDVSTPAVFGNYIDVYDIEQAVEDGATVPIYYETRLVKIHLKEEEEKLDFEMEAVTEKEESSAIEQAKTRWTQLEAIIGNKERLIIVAKDIVEHFEKRLEIFEGKGLIVAMSRRIAVELYNEIIKLRPSWHNIDKQKGEIKVVMTSSSSDPTDWQQHNTSKQDRKKIGDRFKNPQDSLKLVIVRDMWLTGFDVPCLHTMYVDKPMRGHNLMQAIARVNRVYQDKLGGLIVDYVGIASNLKQVLSLYTKSGGQGKPALKQEEAIATMMEKYEIVAQMFHGFDYKRYFLADTKEKMTIILEAQEHILSLKDGKNRFTKQVVVLCKAFFLSVPSLDAMKLKEEVGFFQAIKARLSKFEPSDRKSDLEIETAIKQIVDKAIVADKVIDVFDAAGIKKPDVSILSEEFLAEIKNMQHKNLALELLRKILGDDIKTRESQNFLQSKKLSEMLKRIIKKYQNNLLTTTQVIEEMISLAKEIKKSDKRGEALGLTKPEEAFYDALADNKSAKEVLGNDTLCELARILVEQVKANTTIDWQIRENVRAQLRVIIKRILKKYGYPPDQEKLAIDNILKQTELLSNNWSSSKVEL